MAVIIKKTTAINLDEHIHSSEPEDVKWLMDEIVNMINDNTGEIECEVDLAYEVKKFCIPISITATVDGTEHEAAIIGAIIEGMLIGLNLGLDHR